MKKWRLKTTWFDFSKPKVKTSQDGKTWVVEDKYSLSYYLTEINLWKYLYANETCTYKELKEDLKEELKAYSNQLHIYI